MARYKKRHHRKRHHKKHKSTKRLEKRIKKTINKMDEKKFNSFTTNGNFDNSGTVTSASWTGFNVEPGVGKH